METMMKNFMKSHQTPFHPTTSSNTNKNISFQCDGDGDGDGSTIPSLSPLAHSVLSRSAKILAVSVQELQRRFDAEHEVGSQQLVKHTRIFLEFCCYQVLHHVITTRSDYLSDKDFRRFTYDMMLAWDSPTLVLPVNDSPQNETSISSSEQQEED